MARSALERLLAEASNYPDEETGGLLVGYRDKHAVVITGAIGPGPNASHARTSFDPDPQWQANELAEVYAASGRTYTYLGDWHTHPGGVPAPSRRDRKTLRRIARHRQARQPAPIMVILATGQHADLGLWMYAGRWSSPRRMQARLLEEHWPTTEGIA